MLSEKLKIEPAMLRHPAMSGDLRHLLDDEIPSALLIPDEERRLFNRDVPVGEWNAQVMENPWGYRTLTVLAPQNGLQEVAYHVNYWPTPERNRRRLSQYDWNECEPSPNPGLLAYYVSETLTAISIPMMVKKHVRHSFYRLLFVEINDAPDWLMPAHYHNDPGCTLDEERQLVEQLLQSTR